MLKKLIAILFILCFSLPVMAKKRQSEEIITPMSQLEKRQFQTRTYNSEDKVLIMKAVLNILQDEGFVVYNTNSLLGFIYAQKDYDLSNSGEDIAKEFGKTKSRLNFNGVKVASIESNSNFTDFGDKLRVRINFKRKILNEYGNAQFIEDIEDETYYEEFFNKLDKTIFLLKQKV